MSQTQSFPQLVEATCVKVEGCLSERFSWEGSDWWLIRQADDNQIERNSSIRCTIRVGSVGCWGFVSLNLSKSSFPSFFPAALVITASKIIEKKGRFVLPGLLSRNESPCFLILIIFKQLGSVRHSQPADHSFLKDFLCKNPFVYFQPKAEGRWSYVGDAF